MTQTGSDGESETGKHGIVKLQLEPGRGAAQICPAVDGNHVHDHATKANTPAFGRGVCGMRGNRVVSSKH